MCYGGVLYVRVVYCVLRRCTVCYGDVLCVMAVYVRVVYCVLWRCTLCYGGVLYVRAVDCM